MKKIACPLLIVLLLFSLSVTVSAEKETWDQYIKWKYDTVYDAYSGGYDEGYADGKNECKETHDEIEVDAFSRGTAAGMSVIEAKYQGFAPWWTNLITGASVAVVCSGVFLLIWIIKKKKTVSAAVKAHPSIPEQDPSKQEDQIQNPFIEAKAMFNKTKGGLS